MKNHRIQSRRRMVGFGLVEIMVAMVISMVAIIVVMEVFAGAEARGRTAGGSADAQSAGAITFFQMQSQIKRAGYGLDSAALFDCPLKWTLPSGGSIAKAVNAAPVSINPLSIVAGVSSQLLPSGDDNTDTLLVIYGNGNGQPQGNVVQNISGTTYTVQAPGSFAPGDRVLLAQNSVPTNAAGGCGATERLIDRITAVAATTVAVNAGQTTSDGALFNLGRGPNGPNAAITSSNPSNGPTIQAYAVRNGSLTVCDFTVNDCSLSSKASDTSVWVPMVSDVVGLRATYWKDTSAAWDGSASTSDQTQPTTDCGWARVRGVSLALVIRNPEYDKDIVTTVSADVNSTAIRNKGTPQEVKASVANAPTWDQNAVAPLVNVTGALGPNSSGDAQWKHYRYKTFQGLIPLRNVTWMGQPTGCP